MNQFRLRLLNRKKTWGPTVPGQIEYARDHSLVETVAFQWSQLLDHLLRDVAELPSGRVLQIRYEEILKDPVGQFASVAEFCEVKEPAKLIDLASRRIEQDRPRYADALTNEELACILPIIRPLQERLGYESGLPDTEHKTDDSS